MAYTLEQFCEDKRLPLDWVVKTFALRDGEDTLRYKDDNPGRWKKGEEFKIKGIFFPYNDGNGTQHRIRVSRDRKKRFIWSSDYKRQMLYGLNVPLPDGADTKTIVLVEGESCCITGRMLGLFTLGIAGAPYGWEDRFKNLAPFQNAERIYVVQERKRDDLKPEDIDAGAELVRRVAASFPGKVYAIRLDTNTNIKDLSDLWLESCKLTALCPEYEFVELWNKARACADEKTTEAELDIEDSLPEFPKFTGTLVELAEALCPDLPFCNKFMVGAALVGGAISGKIYLRDLLHIDPRFYAILIDEKGAGKGGSWLEMLRVLKRSLGDLHILESVDSGPALVIEATQHPRLLLFSDELAALFEKAKTSANGRNSLFTELLTLHDGHSTANSAKSNLDLKNEARKALGMEGGDITIAAENVHLSQVGLVQPVTFESMWRGTRGAASGLQSRYCLVSSGQTSVPEPQRPSDYARVENVMERISAQLSGVGKAEEDDLNEGCILPAKSFIEYPEPLRERAREWWTANESKRGASPRIPAILCRLLIVLAVTNSAPAVTQELLDQAFAFGAYQIAMHARFMPEDAISNEQEFEKLIVRCFVKRGTSGLSSREIRQYVNPEKHVLLGGHGPFGRALKNMISDGRLRVDRRGKKEVWWLVSDDEDEA